MKTFYIRNEDKFPVACVVSEFQKMEVGGLVFYAVAAHNPKDPFSKHTAREVAEGRLRALLSKKGTTCPYTGTLQIGDDTPQSVKAKILEHIVEVSSWDANGSRKPIFPQRTRDAAQLWLEEAEEAA